MSWISSWIKEKLCINSNESVCSGFPIHGAFEGIPLIVDILDNDQYSILKRMNQFNRTICEITQDDGKIADIYRRISCSIIELEDILQVIHDIERGVGINNEKLEEINEIFSHIELLKRKRIKLNQY